VAGRRSRSGGRGIWRFLPTASEADRIFRLNRRINQTENGDQLDRSRSNRVFLCIGRSDDLRRARREIYIDTRVKTVVSLLITTRTTILIRCDSRGIGSCRRASETFINRDRVCSALKENFSRSVEYRSRSWEYYCHAVKKVRGNIHIRNECSLQKASMLVENEKYVITEWLENAVLTVDEQIMEIRQFSRKKDSKKRI